ncbi:MAG TPA: hypothetical protein PKB02_14880, partial [Anaerohalosphaeraceae bacterium]|nr:hypothetical protein [Anaerohalosphaeraceae bacterium]
METQIKTNHNKGISLLFLILMLLLSVNLHAVTELFLRADTATMTMPDGRQIHMWGFAQDSAFGAHDGTVTVPGPVLTIDPAETHLIITLENNLPEPVSLIIPGQVAPVAPVSFTDDRGRQRIQSFTHETPVDNVDPVVYEWTNLRPGTFLYQSGSHPALQVQMGLYGGLKKDFADLPVKQAYTGIEYDNDVMLVFSEIDPAVHDAVLANDFGPGKTMTSTINYEPKYFLINGQSYTSAQAPLPVGQINDRILLRLVNAGIKSHVPCLQYLRGEVVAEDGFAYNFPGDQYAIDLPPAKTKDVRIVPSAVGTYLLYDHALGLVNNTSLGGGMMVKLNVGSPVPVIHAVTATPAAIWDTQTSQLLVDATDPDGLPSPLSYNWIIPVGAGSVSDPTLANPVYTPADVATTQVFTLTVEVTDGATTVSSTVDVTVMENVLPIINSVTATPASILDTQTSQLAVDASDADNGPSPLAYNWIVPVGAGSVSDPAIANPIYTPADVATTQIFTLTVEVSDGLATVNSTVDVTVNNTPVGNISPVINSVTATPASILDTQTSQLAVDASDADNGPSPLSYNWIVPVGAGSVSDPAIANPIYTPADVATTQIFTLTVEVSDGSATVSSTVDVTVNDTPVVNIPPVISSVTATPESILDTQTSQLQANATDADNGPSPLSYNWIVPVGAGSV